VARARGDERGPRHAAAPQATGLHRPLASELHESASFAFLLALEALGPQQRAVLLLRDVLDYSVRETADALGLSEANVKTAHHRARHAMAAYDRSRRPKAVLEGETRTALERFLGALLAGDAAAAAACLTAGARLLSDGAGEFRAALRPVLGPDRITRFFLGLQKKLGPAPRFEVRSINGLPSVVAAYDDPPDRWGPRFVLHADTDSSGKISELHVVVASRKLTHVGAI
jgi:RNA polymerase sigma-70 factor, ECF subfamily